MTVSRISGMVAKAADPAHGQPSRSLADLAKEEPRTRGESAGRGGAALPWSAGWLVAGREGKREFKNLVVDEDAQIELLGVLVALEPDDTGDFFFRGDGLGLENVGLNLLGYFAKIVGSGSDDR